MKIVFTVDPKESFVFYALKSTMISIKEQFLNYEDWAGTATNIYRRRHTSDTSYKCHRLRLTTTTGDIKHNHLYFTSATAAFNTVITKPPPSSTTDGSYDPSPQTRHRHRNVNKNHSHPQYHPPPRLQSHHSSHCKFQSSHRYHYRWVTQSISADQTGHRHRHPRRRQQTL